MKTLSVQNVSLFLALWFIPMGYFSSETQGKHTIMILAAFLSLVRDEAPSPIQTPLPRFWSVTPARIRTNPNTDKDIAFGFLGFGASLGGTCGILGLLISGCTSRIRPLSRRTSALGRRSFWVSGVCAENRFSIPTAIQQRRGL